MIKTQNRKILRDIWARKSRTAMVAISIFIGVLGVITLSSVGELTIDKLENEIDQDELAMLWVYGSVPSNSNPDNAAYLEELRQLEGITDVEASANYPVYWRLDENDSFSEGSMRASSEAFGKQDLMPMKLIKGKYPVQGQQQIVIERRMADRLDLAVGDTIEFRVLSEKADTLANIKTETWTVSGIVYHLYGGGQSAMYGSYNDAQHLAGFSGYSVFLARYATYELAVENNEQFTAKLSDISPYAIRGSFTENPADSEFINEVKQWTDTLTALGFLAMIVSTFIVFNVVNAILAEQRRQIGVMKSLGATRWDNFRIFGGISLVYGLLGTIPGVLLGIPAGYYLTTLVAPLIEIIFDQFTIAPTAVLYGVIMGLFIPLLASILPVFFGTRVTIREAITDLGIGTRFKRGPLARLVEFIPMPMTMRQAIGNILQKKARLAVTGFTLTLAVGSFMGIFALFYAMDDVIKTAYATYNYQIEVQPNETQDFNQMKTLLASIDGVSQIFPSIDSGLRITDSDPRLVEEPELDFNYFVNGFDTSSDSIKLDLEEGTAWKNDPNRQGIVITKDIAVDKGLKLGDTLYLTAENGNTESFEIIGIDRFPFGGIFLNWETLAHLIGYTVNAPIPNEYTTAVTITNSSQAENVTAFGLDKNAEALLQFTAGHFLESDTPSVIITSDLANQDGHQVGDTLALNAGQDTRIYTITGIVDTNTALFQDTTDFAKRADNSVFAIGLYWQELASLEGRTLNGEVASQEFAIRTMLDEPSVAEVDKVIGTIRDTLLANGISADYYNAVADAEEENQTLMTVGLIFGIACLVMAMVGAIGLLVTLSMSVFERQREIGVMRSVGASSGTVVIQFLIEGILVGLIAWLFGVPLSIGISNLLLEVLPIDFEFVYPPISLVLGFAGILIIATVASIWPSVMAARKTVSSILRYQ